MNSISSTVARLLFGMTMWATAGAAWHGLDPGPHGVGVRFETLRGQEGVLAEYGVAGELDGPAEIQVALWYPAMHDGGAALRYGDYVDLGAGSGPGDGRTDAAIRAHRVEWLDAAAAKGVAPDSAEALLELPVAARREATPGPGRYPLLLLAQGGGGVLSEQFLLAEYLASHGYVVVSMPHPAALGVPGPESLAAQVDLTGPLIDLARGHGFVDPGRLGLVGYSHCGACNLVYQHRSGEADVLLSLDGWEGWRSGAEFMTTSLGSEAADPAGPLAQDPLHGAPYAYLASDPRIVRQYQDPETWDHSLVARFTAGPDGFLAYFRDLRHPDFTSTAMLEWIAPGISYSTGWHEGSRLDEATLLVGVHRAARLFLDAHLKDDAAAARSLCDLTVTLALDPELFALGASGACGIGPRAGVPFTADLTGRDETPHTFTTACYGRASANRRARSAARSFVVDSGAIRVRSRRLAIVTRLSRLIAHGFGRPSSGPSGTSEGIPRTRVDSGATVTSRRIS